MPIKIDNIGTGGSGDLTAGITTSGAPVEGSWRIIAVGNNLVNQRYESGDWVEKTASTP